MLRAIRPWLGLLLLAAVLHPSPSPAKPALREPIRGTAIYRGRVALPPGSVLEARLVDVSRGARGRTLARAVHSSPREFPISFEIPYDTDRLDAHGAYVVRASLTVGNWVRYRGETRYAAPRRGHGVVNVEMRRADDAESDRGEGRQEDRDPSRGLENVRWAAVRIADRAVPATGREPWIALDSRSGRATGSGGCNRMTAGYEAAFGRLRFGSMAATKMACTEMRTEGAFFNALERTRRYSLSGRQVRFLDGSGTVLAILEERELR